MLASSATSSNSVASSPVPVCKGGREGEREGGREEGREGRKESSNTCQCHSPLPPSLLFLRQSRLAHQRYL